MTAIKQTVYSDAEFDLRANATYGREPADCSLDDVELNEFTLCGKTWDLDKITMQFVPRPHRDNRASPEWHAARWKAQAVWQFMTDAASDAAEPDAWETDDV